MAKLEVYDKSLDYSYAPGIFPATECLRNAPERGLRLLLSSASERSEGAQKLRTQAEALGVRAEIADRALERISKKENCFAAMVYKKQEGVFDAGAPHIVRRRSYTQKYCNTFSLFLSIAFFRGFSRRRHRRDGAVSP